LCLRHPDSRVIGATRWVDRLETCPT
jgi:hypothetical protein